MDEIWERAVETALDGQMDHAAARNLTLDGAVKCVQGRLAPPSFFERFHNLQHLSIANIGVSSLEQFPRLRNLQKLILSDNRIAGGLEHLVEAGLESLRDLDLSNNRIQFIEDLAPLARLSLVSLDLYECPVTRIKDYRSRVFGLIKSLKYLDKMDGDGNERPESDDEEDEEDEEDDDDPGSGEIDAEERPDGPSNGHTDGLDGIVDVDDDEESDADEEETEIARPTNGANRQSNGFHVAAVDRNDVDDVEDGGEDDDSGEEIDEAVNGTDTNAIDVLEILYSDDEDGVEDEDAEDDDDDGEEYEDGEDDDGEEEEVDNEEGDVGGPGSGGWLTGTEGEIDGHEQGEDDEDDNGETGEEEQGVDNELDFLDDEDDVEEEDEDNDAGYLVQPVGQAEVHDAGGSDLEPVFDEEDDDLEVEEVEDDNELVFLPSPPPPSSSSQGKRKRNDDSDEDEEDIDEDDDVDDDTDEDDDNDGRNPKSSKKHR